MTYNIGDTIRITNAEYDDHLTEGKVYEVIQVDADDDYMPVQVTDDDGDAWWVRKSSFELVTSNNSNELAELRDFKARALARFPVLAEQETDEEAAERLANAYSDSYSKTVEETIKEAIAWARANPR